MEQFQRFEEDQQIQTYQQPVGFNPVRSTSESGAIRQQAGIQRQSEQFYNQSLKQRQDIRAYNWKVKDQNDANYYNYIDQLKQFIPGAQAFLQQKVDEGIKRNELEAANEEWQEVYDNGFTDEQRAEEAQGRAAETDANINFGSATEDAMKVTGNPEIARITSEQNPYRRAAKAKIYAQRMASENPIALQNHLQQFSQDYAAANGGMSPTAAEIRAEVASHNGAYWAQTGLNQFKPTFLGEKYVSTYRANQEKVIGSQLTANRISDGAVIRTQAVAGTTQETVEADPAGHFSTFIADTAATLNGRGAPYGHAQALADYKKALVATGMDRNQIESVLRRIPDPVLKGKTLAERSGMKQEMDIAVSNRNQNAQTVRRREEQIEYDQKVEAFAPAYTAADETTRRKMLLEFNRGTSHMLYADRSALNRLTRGLNDPQAANAARMRLDEIARNGGTITKEMLDAEPSLTYQDYRYYLDAGRRNNQQKTEEEKQIDGYLGQVVKEAGTFFYKDLGDGTGIKNTPLGDRLEDVLRTELQFQLAEVQRSPDTAGLKRSQQIQIAAGRTTKLAKTKYGVGLTQKDVDRLKNDDDPDNDVADPIFATNAGNPKPDALSATSQLDQFDANAATIDLDEAKSVYSKEELDQRVKQIEGGGAPIFPTWRERQIMQDQGIVLSDLINRQRAALNQPAIPDSVWEQQIKNLSPETRAIFLNPATTDEQRARTTGEMEMPAQPAPTEQVQTQQQTGQGGPSLPVSTDAQGNRFNQAAVLANPDYGRFAAPYLPLIEKAAAASGVPAALLAALGGQESHFKNFEGPDLGGGMGRAQGPFQVVPYWHPTAPDYKTDMYGHILYAANYLKSLYDEEGSWKGAMRRYNGGYGDDEYQDPVLKNAYGYGMSTLLSDRGFMRPTFAQLA